MSFAASATTATAATSAAFLGSSPATTNIGDLFSELKQAIQSVLEKLGIGDEGGGSAPQADERKLVQSDNAITADPLGVKDAYDLQLYREPSGDYTLEVHMGVDFNFNQGTDPAGNALQWTEQEKQAFMADYQKSVEEVWDGRAIRTAPDGGEVKLDIKLDTRETMTGENWNIDVVRAAPGQFVRSYMSPSTNSASLDSNDVIGVNKGAGDGILQSGAAHEFGHMLGLDDEYTGGAHVDDLDSIMNAGSTVESRHLQNFSDWVSQALR